MGAAMLASSTRGRGKVGKLLPPAHSRTGCKAMLKGSHQPARTATVESDVKSPALFFGGEKGKRSCAK